MPSRWKLVMYGLIVLLGSLIAVPNVLTSSQLNALPGWVPKKQVALGLDLKGGAHMVLELDYSKLRGEHVDKRAAMEQTLEIVRKRIDSVGVAEPTIQAIGSDRVLVQLPGVQNPAAIRTLLGSMAKLSYHWLHADGNAIPAESPGEYTVVPDMDGAAEYTIHSKPFMLGDHLKRATAEVDPDTGRYVVADVLDPVGTKQLAKISREHVGDSFAAVLDGRVITTAYFVEPILSGRSQLKGQFSFEEAASIAALMRAGALPVPLKVVDERTVGAGLGSDAIHTGAVTGAIGLLLVLGFMTVLYGVWGLVANIALMINVALTLAALTLLGATLTLPGIAGIILGIGLAVDANVLINERIREETRNGKNAWAALEAGFKRAYATIVDSNVTTLIATTLLFFVGSGPVRGFAVTMGLGILISMFTAVSVVRAVMALWVKYRKPQQFVIGTLLPKSLVNREPKFKFMRARFAGIGLSLVLSVASVAMFFKPGLNYGVDFTGGVMIEASASVPMPISKLRAELGKLTTGEVALQEFGDGKSILIRLEKPIGAGEAVETQIAESAKTAIRAVQPDVIFDRVDIVSPKVSDELAESGSIAVLFACLAMLLYIWYRFEWHFAIGAIATLLLDATKTLGFFALTGIEFNLTAIAALLTIVGYSVNDKVVVYDRMRENMALKPDMPLREIIDLSINETLARSLYTSATAFLAMLPMAIWGGVAVQSFAVPMVFGIVIAASSSVFIAAPILLFLGDWRTRRRRQSMPAT